MSSAATPASPPEMPVAPADVPPVSRPLPAVRRANDPMRRRYPSNRDGRTTSRPRQREDSGDEGPRPKQSRSS
jgi:hypothetical protein